MRIPFFIERLMGVALTAAATGAGLGGIVLLLALPAAPRWLALATIALVILAGVGVAWLARLQALARHPYRIRAARHVVTVRNRAPDASGVPLASAAVASETEFEPLSPGAASLRLQKFVAEPSSIDPGRMLEDWGYACRIGPAAMSPAPYLSASRSLQIDLPLPRPSLRSFTLEEALSFDVLLDAPARFVFQPSYPADRQSVEIRFEGPRPAKARYRIERGLGAADSGALALDSSARIRFEWGRAEPGHQLVIDWEWDSATLPAPLTETERLIAAARQSQAEIEKRLAVQFGDMAPDETDTAPAEEHWIIRAARLREAHYSGGTPEAPTLAGESGFVGDADDTPAEDHPIIKAAREREKIYRKD